MGYKYQRARTSRVGLVHENQDALCLPPGIACLHHGGHQPRDIGSTTKSGAVMAYLLGGRQAIDPKSLTSLSDNPAACSKSRHSRSKLPT
jgi:hypothetical protein